MLKKIIAAGAVAALLAATPAQAAVTVITFLDGTSGSHNGAFALDGSSNAYALSVLCGGAAATPGTTVAQCAQVDSSGRLSTLDSQSGTWTVQPGNTANTTAWLVTGTGGTFPVTGTFWQTTQPVSIAAFTAWGGGTITGAPSAYGTAPTGNVPGVNAFVTNTNANGSAVSASSSPVVIASDQAAVAVKAASASIASGAFASGSIGSGAIAAGAAAGDPCMFGIKTNLAISTNATALTQIIAASGSTKIYICSVALVAPGATAISLNSGTGTNCGTSTAAVIGSTTAANGMSFAANGGLTLGNGSGVVAVTASSSQLCTLQSNAVQVAGNLTYVQAP